MVMADQRRQYTAEFKRQAVDMLNSGKSGREVERELEIGAGMAYRWRRELAGEVNGLRAFPGNGAPRDEELARLKRENKELREEHEILAKAVAFFSKDPKRRSGS